MENKKQKPVMVQLKTKKNGNVDSKTRSFEISQANSILKLRNTQWQLDDKGFEWNGTEIAKKAK